MSLEDVTIPKQPDELPPDVESFIRTSEERIDQFFARHKTMRVPRFVASDARRVYLTLRAIRENELALGDRFCEWGSGFGIITSLADILDYDALGIEIEGELVEEAESLARDHDVRARFICGSYIPNGYEYYTDGIGDTSALSRTLTLPSQFMNSEKLVEDEIEIEDFDVIFTFPWPGEVELIETLFDARAAEGALLVTYDELDGPIVQRRIY